MTRLGEGASPPLCERLPGDAAELLTAVCVKSLRKVPLPGTSSQPSAFLLQPAARPPVPAHQVLPYKAVSARFRPFTFSQSTPIGLDRVGRRRQMRASNGESPGPALFGGPPLRNRGGVLGWTAPRDSGVPAGWRPSPLSLWARAACAWE